MKENFSKFLKHIPDDFKHTMKALGNEFRFRLILLLLEEQSLSLSKLSEILKKKNSLIISHLKKLESAGIVQNYIHHTTNKREYSFYEITKYGEKMVKTIINHYNNLIASKLIEENFLNFLEIPDDVVKILKALSNQFRLSLLLFFLQEQKYSFTEIVDFSEKSKNSIANHLKIMEIAGLIQNFYEKQDTSSYSFYSITNIGKSLISNLNSSYNDYYQYEIEQVDKMESERYIENHFNIYCSEWGLPNEILLGWIEIYDKSVNKIEIKLDLDLKINTFFNFEYDHNPDDNIYSFDIVGTINYIPFEFISKIPESNTPINKRTLDASAFDAKHNLLQNMTVSIEILRPVVKLEVIKREVSGTSGIFEIKISFLSNIHIKIPSIEFKVTDMENKDIRIVVIDKDPIEISQDLRPGIDLENLIGEFIINKPGIFKIHFRIPYTDAADNNYYSNKEIIEIGDVESFEGNLNYQYNYESMVEVSS